jgi:adenosylmethionine-8-amino-7-oxononanoate aminotransferase
MSDQSTQKELKRGSPIQVFYSGNSKSFPTISHAKGLYMWDTNGKKYFDASSGPVATNLGHANPSVLEAMRIQSEKVCFASYSVFENEPNKTLAKNLVKLAGPNFDQAFIVSGGSEAIESAFKLAKQYAVAIGEPKRSKILSREVSYHGSTLGAFAASGDPETEKTFGSMAKLMPKVKTPFAYRVPQNHDVDSYARECAKDLENTINEEGPENILAFIVESVGGLATGALVAPDHYYKAIRDICTKYGVLLIFDDVMAGTGRTGTFLSAEHWPQASPDLVVLAKGVSAGYTPLGAVLVPNRIVKEIVTSGGFLHGHTYVANPLSCAIANAVLTEMIDQDLMQNASKMGKYLKDELIKIAQQSLIIGDVRGKGLLLAIEIVQNKQTRSILSNKTRAVYRLLEIGIEEGILVYTRKTSAGVYGEWLMITPALTITKQQVDELIELLTKTINRFEKELNDGGFLNTSKK